MTGQLAANFLSFFLSSSFLPSFPRFSFFSLFLSFFFLTFLSPNWVLKDIHYVCRAILKTRLEEANLDIPRSKLSFSIFFLSIWGSLKLINGNFTLAFNEPLFNEFPPRSEGSIDFCSKRSLKRFYFEMKSGNIDSFVYIHFFRIIESDYIIIVEII